MKDFPLERSRQVKHGVYANFTPSSEKKAGIFLAGFEECLPDYRIDREEFPFWTLEMIVRGEGYCREGKNLQKLQHGSVFTYGPGVSHNFWNETYRPFHKYFLVHSGNQFPAMWTKMGLHPGELYQLSSVAPVVIILDQIIDEEKDMDAQTGEVLSGLQQVLLARIARHQGKGIGDKSASRAAYELAMELVLQDYRSLHSLSDLAERSGYSAEYLCRVFKKYHKESPYQSLLHRKMSMAWLLLRDGQLQVSAVARELGYEDPLHFSRVFRKIMGCSPSRVKTR